MQKQAGTSTGKHNILVRKKERLCINAIQTHNCLLNQGIKSSATLL